MPAKEEIAAVINKIIKRQDKPATLHTIQRNLPGPYRVTAKILADIMAEQVKMKAIYQWPESRNKKRFWIYELEMYAQRMILEVLSNQNLTCTELQNALAGRLFGCSLKSVIELRKNLLKRLLKQKRIFMHPPAGRQRLERFGIQPPSVEPYFGKIRAEFEAVCEKLTGAGVPRDQIFETANKILSIRLPRLSIDTSSKTESAQVAAEIYHDVHEAILAKITEIEPAAQRQVLIPISKLRKALDLTKIIFDQAILQLAERGKIFLHRHVYPTQMNDAERRIMVTDGQGNYYIGIVLRN